MLIKPISKTAIIYKNVLNLNSELAPRSVKFFFSQQQVDEQRASKTQLCTTLCLSKPK